MNEGLLQVGAVGGQAPGSTRGMHTPGWVGWRTDGGRKGRYGDRSSVDEAAAVERKERPSGLVLAIPVLPLESLTF